MTSSLPHIEILIVITIAAVLWIVGSIFTLKKNNNLKGIRRICFLAIAFTGISLIIIQPQHEIKLDPELVHIWTSEKSTIKESENNFYNVHEFLQSDLKDKTSEIHIHGIGLEEAELSLLKNYPLSFYPSPIVSGITNVNIPTITEGEQWTLSGNVQGKNVEEIYLEGIDDRKEFADLIDSTFTIVSYAPVAGPYLLNIHTVLSSGDTLTEILPIDVNHEPSWQMLVLSSYPGFENNYLKNYWTSLGNGFAMRSKISKEKFHTTFVNSSKQNLDNLTTRIISKYDFIITDSPTWNQLSISEQSNIRRAIRNNGLALILRPTVNLNTPIDLRIPNWKAPKEINWATATDDIKLSVYPIESNWESATSQGHTLAKYQSRGLGHIAMLGIDNTYKLILSDQTKEYQKLWSTIFTELYRDFSPRSKLFHNPWMWAENKTTVSILSEVEINTPPVLNKTTSLPYMSVPFLEGVIEVDLWPSNGYNEIDFSDNQSLKFYAHPKNTWRTVKQNQLQKINLQAASNSKSLKPKEFHRQEPYCLYWWYALALLGFGGLWLDERLYGF